MSLINKKDEKTAQTKVIGIKKSTKNAQGRIVHCHWLGKYMGKWKIS